MMTEVKEIKPDNILTVYMLMRIDSLGFFTQLPPTVGQHTIIGNLWARQDEAQHEQMMQALKGQQYKVFELKWDMS